MTRYPTSDDVLAVHYELVALFAGEENPIAPPGPRDLGLLASACNRPRTALGGTQKYKTTVQKAAALFHSLVKNHPFHNGNKRTALATLVTFLWRNDRRINSDVTDDEVFDMVVGIANNEFPHGERKLTPDEVVHELGRWLRQRTTSLRSAASGMRVGEFLKKCKEAGMQWKESRQSYVIWKDKEHSVRLSKSTGKLEGPVVREYLNQLGLTDVLVDEFQEGLRPEQEELRRFRGVLRRLAHA